MSINDKAVQVREFQWPSSPRPVPFTASETILDSDHCKIITNGKIALPTHQRKREIIKAACAKFAKLGVNAARTPVLIDVAASARFAPSMSDLAPCVLKAHPLGPWDTLTGDHITTEELLRCQGYSSETLPWQSVMSKTKLGECLGNGVTVNVLEVLVEQGLKSIGKI